MNKREYIHEIYKYVSMNSILYVDSNGVLKRLYCPFWVEVIIDVPPFIKGDKAQVIAVKMTLELKDVFIIGESAYYVWYFRIIT